MPFLFPDAEQDQSEKALRDFAGSLQKPPEGQVFGLAQTWPARVAQSLAQSLWSGFTAPGDVYAGRLDPMSDEGLTRTMDLAGLVIGSPEGALPRAGEDELASRSARIYNPPSKPQRAFELDYPTQAEGSQFGQPLERTIEGAPLQGKYIAGRSSAGGVDAPLPQEALDAITTAATGRGPSVLPASEARGDLGRVPVNRVTRQPTGILLRDNIPEATFDRVYAHEVGHVIDQTVGEIPVTGLNTELKQIYNTLNTGQERTSALTGPQHVGYSATDAPREMMAEAIRAYMADPNYLKTVAPKTAARIREHVNTNPRLSGTVQFNVGGALPIVGSGFLAPEA